MKAARFLLRARAKVSVMRLADMRRVEIRRMEIRVQGFGSEKCFGRVLF
jgi:hypothetical protein